MQVLQVTTTRVAQLYPLEVIPDPLVGVEIGCVAGKLFQVQPFGRPSLEKIFDLVFAMDRRAVPDHHQFARNLAQEPPQPLHAILLRPSQHTV